MKVIYKKEKQIEQNQLGEFDLQIIQLCQWKEIDMKLKQHFESESTSQNSDTYTP